MSKIILDTNAMYSWLSISPNEKMPASAIENLFMAHDVCVTTPTLVEIVTKYREDLNTIRLCFAPIVADRLKVIAVNFFSFDPELIQFLYSSEDLGAVHTAIDDVVVEKLKIEAKFLHFILVTIVNCMTHALNEAYQMQLQHTTQRNLLMASSLNFIKANEDQFLVLIQEALNKGYSDGIPQQSVKECFSTILFGCVHSFVSNFYVALASLTRGEVCSLSVQDTERLEHQIDSDKLLRRFNKKYADNPMALLFEKQYRKGILRHLEELRMEFSSWPNLTPEVVKVLLDLIEALVCRTKKIEKNDVTDIMIVYALHIEDTKILTADTRLIRLLQLAGRDVFTLA